MNNLKMNLKTKIENIQNNHQIKIWMILIFKYKKYDNELTKF